MDSTYIEMTVPNCSSEISDQCNSFTVSVTSLSPYSTSSPMMHTLEPSLNVANTKLEPDSSKEMPPPSTIPGVPSVFSTVEFSGCSQASCESNEMLSARSPGSKSSGTSTGSSSNSAENLPQGHSASTPCQVTSQAIFQHPQQENSVQYFQAHVTDQRPGSVSASPGPSGSCGSGGSPAPSTSLSHPSVGSPWSFDAGCLPNPDNSATPTHSALTVVTTSAFPSQSADGVKTEKPQPPKKPLTPYMRFSKSIWQQVKAANPSLSVCEVGATIGRMWREMNETDKQRYNDDFAIDKVRYDGELQSYLKMTGLQASDLVKPKAKKKDARDKLQTSLRLVKPQGLQFGTAETASSGAASVLSDQTSGPVTTTVSTVGSFNGSNVDTLHASGFQTVGVSEECSSLGTALGTLPHFSQVWAGQEVYANPQLLAQMGMAAGQTIFTNQTMGEQLNASRLVTIQPQEQNEGSQVATLYSAQSQSSQHLGNQCTSAHQNMHLQQMSVEGLSESMTSSLDNATALNSTDNAWLWQQYNAGNQFVQEAMMQSSLPQTQNHENVIIYQLTSDGSQNSLVRSSVEPSIQTNHNLPAMMISKPSLAVGNGTMETILEPGEVPLSGQLQAVPNGPLDTGLYDLNQLCGLTPWNPVKDEKLDFVQPVDGEKQLLRCALQEKNKEIQRLTRELELAYGLIHQLKQQNDLYQRHWNSQQQPQQQQQQQLLHIAPKTGSNTDNGTGISISS